MTRMLTKQLTTAILTLISEGSSVRNACYDNGVKPTTFLTAVRKDGKLAEQYARARDMCADWHFDGIWDDIDAVERGDLDPQAARVAIDAKKWILARMRPDAYGDRVRQEISGPNGEAVTHRVTLRIVDSDGDGRPA